MLTSHVAVATVRCTCSVSDLARLSLSDPEFIAVHADAAEATPQRLRQFFVSVPLQRKLDLLWFFIKTHQKQRTIVFLATCKQVCARGVERWALCPHDEGTLQSAGPQIADNDIMQLRARACALATGTCVDLAHGPPIRAHFTWLTIHMHLCLQVKFVHEAFRKLRPGVPLGMLHGKMKQMKRMAVFCKFGESKAMVLLATDIAARGLDFQAVDWVVQADCAENADAYIHRVGRTARFRSGAPRGRSHNALPAPGLRADAQPCAPAMQADAYLVHR
jgi:Helicase conserved C-terminal domain